MSNPEGNIQENNEYIYIGDVTVSYSPNSLTEMNQTSK